MKRWQSQANEEHLLEIPTLLRQPSLIAMFHIAKALDCPLPKLIEAVLVRYHTSQTIRQNPRKPYGNPVLKRER